jgi:CubicO group peptidase (beta-lactamase class C family)
VIHDWSEVMPRKMQEEDKIKLVRLLILNFLLAAVMLIEWRTCIAESPVTSKQTFAPTEDTRIRRTINNVNWDDGGEITHYVYLHTSEIFQTAVISARTPATPLEEASKPEVGSFIVSNEKDQKVTLDKYLAESRGIDGFIVLHHGKVVYEKYPHMNPDDKHLIMSVTKAFIGAAVGILEDKGKIDIKRPVGDYVAALKGTDWQDVPIRDILEMASGMEGANESYTDPTNKHYQYEASLGWQPKTAKMPESVREEDTYRYLASLKKLRKPGEAWAYTSVNSAILTWLLEEVTGKSLARVLSEEIWAPMGAESDAQIVVNSKGVAAAHGGMVTRLRDLARFGLLFTPSWNKTAHTRVISENFQKRILENGRPDLVKEWIFGPRPDWLDHVAYQWDAITKQGKFFKGGFGGQLLYVAPQKDVVIAYFGTNQSIGDAPPRLSLGELIDALY